MHARILVPCVIIFMRRVLKNYLHRYWRTVVLGGHKLAEGCYSKWGYVPSGVPQGTKLGPTPVPYFDQ